MTKNFFSFAFALLAVAVVSPLASCSSSDDGPKTSNLTVNIALPSDVTAENAKDLQCVLTKNGKSDTIALENTNAFTKLLTQGSYSIYVTGKVADEATAYLTGTSKVDLYSDLSTTVTLSKANKSSLIFKSIFTTGGKLGYMKDGYFEIVNNSDEVQYLDQLILLAPQGGQTAENEWQANGYEDLYNSGQGCVLAFPGSGTEYPLQPGQSIVIAQDAADHTQLAGDGNNCADLTNADWEIFLDYVKGDIDYSAPNMEVIFQNNAYMKAFALGFFSRGYVMAKLPAGTTPKDFAADAANFMTTPGTTSTMKFMVIPSKYVLDAVDMWDSDATSHYGTFLTKDDAEGVLASTTWAGKSLRRKVTSITAGGRVYYKDTNKSSDDFLNNQPLTPGVIITSVDQ